MRGIELSTRRASNDNEESVGRGIREALGSSGGTFYHDKGLELSARIRQHPTLFRREF